MRPKSAEKPPSVRRKSPSIEKENVQPVEKGSKRKSAEGDSPGEQFDFMHSVDVEPASKKAKKAEEPPKVCTKTKIYN